MHIGKKNRRLSALALLVSLCVFTNTGMSVHADNSDLRASIKAKQAEIEEAEKEKKQIQSNITNAKNIVSSLQAAKKDLEAYLP